MSSAWQFQCASKYSTMYLNNYIYIFSYFISKLIYVSFVSPFLFLHPFLFFYITYFLSNYSCPHSPPLLIWLPTATSHPTPLSLSMVPLYLFLGYLPPSLPCYSPLPSPLVTVSLFFISTSQVIFCSLVCFVD